MTDAKYEGLEHFRAWEFGPHAERMQSAFLLKLDRARALAGIPFYVSSAWRDDPDGPHGEGYGVDIRIEPFATGVSKSRARYLIVKAALEVGISRIGVYDQHVHLDIDPDEDPDVLWVGVSQ